MLKKAFFHIISWALLLVTVGVLIGFIILYHLNKDLPDHSTLKNYSPPVLSRVFSSDGRLIGEHAQEKRIFVPYEYIPPKIIHAFLAAEDQNFFYHKGIDVLSIFRAAMTNVMSNGKRPGGASTITQQVARNFFLTNELSLVRKLKEVILAIRIEQVLSKERIIEIYLNQIFLGNRSYGVAAAALRYFNKSLEDLTVPEIAFLAGLPKAPSTYNPKRNPQAAMNRRNWVLERLWKTGLIEEGEFRAFTKHPIELLQRDETENVRADYFQETVRKELIDVFGEDAFYGGGLFIKTSLDTRLQTICNEVFPNALLDLDKKHGWRGAIRNIADVEKDPNNIKHWMEYLHAVNVGCIPEGWRLALVTNLESTKTTLITEEGVGVISMDTMKWAGAPLKNGVPGASIKSPDQALNIGDLIFVSKIKDNQYALQQIPKISGGMVVMDPHTGRVLALTGGFSFQQSQFNRATQAMRQSGSSIKPFVYLTAFERGVKPTDTYVDEPISIHLGQGLGTWTPKNFMNEFKGAMTVRRALETSNNMVTIKLAQKVGMKNVAKVIKKMGIIDKPPIQLALVLGSGETTVYKMTTAFAIIANGGKKITPTVVDWVQDKEGKMLYKHDDRKVDFLRASSWDGKTIPTISDTRTQIVDPAHAYMITSILQGAVENSPAKTAFVPGQILAGKSGTSNDSKDVWYIGYSANLVVGIYLGYDVPQGLGKMATGGWLAAPIFKTFMEKALENEPAIPFQVPSNAKLYRVNKHTGQATLPNDPDAMWEIAWQKDRIFETEEPSETSNESSDKVDSIPADRSGSEPTEQHASHPGIL
ncbi:penicillin-binding protein 1A [Candidatus Bodocaedibacter vickermanii]|uniref:Penicillin-binding protein 1A n=1 Tax=Candidatus Bodocaedibacter vickermanii TaxID=2741701 RepID=A0A7L9RT54_9PROT|nr:Penicillin-binding protein 1A [Candidatus Paracaedibacteraceae bacterium 'Lake Konstanz']